MRSIITLALLLLAIPPLLCAQANKVAGVIAERALAPIAKEAAEQTAKEVAGKVAATVGKQLAESTEAQLAKAIAANGAEVGTLALRVPEAAEMLARNAKVLLPLTERLGDDVLRLEARAPGIAELAAKNYGKEELPRLLKLSEPEMKGVISLSTHATEPRAAMLLLEETEKGGMKFLEKISGTQILATGLSVASILAVQGTLEKIPAGPETTAAIGDFFSKLLSPVSAVAAALLAAWGSLAIWRNHRRNGKVG